MTLLDKQCSGKPHINIFELEEGVYHFSFSWTKLVNSKGKLRHHTHESLSCLLLPHYSLPSTDCTYPVSLE